MIEITYITQDAIVYFCTHCQQKHAHPIDAQDGQQDWFRFSCVRCGEHVKRTVNLRKVLGRSVPHETA